MSNLLTNSDILFGSYIIFEDILEHFYAGIHLHTCVRGEEDEEVAFVGAPKLRPLQQPGRSFGRELVL